MDPSFPSDHAVAAFAIAVALLLRNRRIGILALAMAVVLGIARITVGTHYPTDVLAGAVLGAASALMLWLPPVRLRLHRLSDACGAIYDKTMDRLLRRPAGSNI